MNIPSPTVTTTEITPQHLNQSNVSTTVSIPDESSHLIAPLIEFRNATNYDGKDRRGKSDGGTLGTCMALAELTSALFELFNDTAFAGVIDDRGDEEGGNTAFWVLSVRQAARPSLQ